MKRRIFIRNSALFSALVSMGRIPCYARTDGQKNRNIFTDPPAIEPITGYLPEFNPLPSSRISAGQWRLTYDLIRWDGTENNVVSVNEDCGSLLVERQGSQTSGRYTIKRNLLSPIGQRLGGVQKCVTEAQLRTHGNAESLRDWTVTTFHHGLGPNAPEQPDSRHTVEGRCDGTSFRLLRNGRILSEQPLNGPLVASWSIPELLLRNTLDRSSPFQFTMLEEGMLLRTDQQLVCEGTIEIETGAGKGTWESWRQTGDGILPIHWITDKQSCPQIMTHSAMNWLLSDASA